MGVAAGVCGQPLSRVPTDCACRMFAEIDKSRTRNESFFIRVAALCSLGLKRNAFITENTELTGETCRFVRLRFLRAVYIGCVPVENFC